MSYTPFASTRGKYTSYNTQQHKAWYKPQYSTDKDIKNWIEPSTGYAKKYVPNDALSQAMQRSQISAPKGFKFNFTQQHANQCKYCKGNKHLCNCGA